MHEIDAYEQTTTSLVAETPRPSELDGLNFLWLEITGRCNLTCTHCYADSGPSGTLQGAMTRDDWTRVIDQAAAMGCRQVQFIGGEPTLHPELPALIDRARNQGFTFIEVFTNATRLSQPLIQCLREYSVHVAASFYSYEPVVHDEITGKPGSWQQTVTGLRHLVNAQVPVRVGIIEMARNFGQVPRTTEFLCSLGIRDVSADRLRQVGRGESIANITIGERFDELCGKCWRGKLCVTPSGEAFPCVFSRATPVGDAKAGLASVLESEALRRFRARVYTYRDSTSGEAHANCNPYCDPSCNPECTPRCPPSCTPECMPMCRPNCSPECRPYCNPECSPNRYR